VPLTVRIFNRGKMNDIELSNKKTISVGSGEKDDYIVEQNGIKVHHIVFSAKGSSWQIRSLGNTYVGNNLISEKNINKGDAFVLKAESNIAFLIYDAENSIVKKVDLESCDIISIGRNSNNTIQFLNSRVSGNHVEIYRKGDKFVIEDLHSTNGTYVNGLKVKKTYLTNNDVISVGIYDIIYINNTLIIRNASDDININANIVQHESATSEEYPVFKRSPRLKLEVPTGEIEIEAPPTIGSKPEINWLTVIIPPLSMVGIMVSVVLLTHGSTMSLYYTAPMSLISILVAIMNFVSQRKKHKNKENLRLEKYKEHLRDVVVQIEKATKEQIKALNMASPSLNECFDMVRNIDRRLWEKKPQDSDFVHIRIGTGTTDLTKGIKIPKNSLSIEEDSLKTKPDEIYEKYSKVKNCPVVCPMLSFPTCGIVGKREDVINLTKNMIAHIATLHCYTDVRIVTVFNDNEKKEFEWVKWLPHSFDEERQKRYIASSKYAASELFKELEEIFKQREQELNNEESFREKNIKLPYYLFVISDPMLLEGETIAKYLLSNNKNLGVGALLLFDDISMLPKDCTAIIEVRNKKGVIYNKENIADKKKFVFDSSPMADFDAFGRSIAPIRVPELSENSMLPACVTFFDGYGIKYPEELDLKNNWTKNLTYKSMGVPVGVKANGEAFYFDIHEKKHGPHGLVAGMTGSGKSEMVQSWILSMALKFSPADVSFVLIDFKGTGLILPFTKMPHLAGTISDLDTNIKRNLIALENELSRRKALLDSVGVNNITAYLKLYKEGKTKEPLSFLFIIIDEFAEFKVQFPDFMTVVNRIFAIGRTLGVFAILLTQKPAGVVDDKMNANTRFRWCLKVASSADSKEMIKHPDAAKITNPGRAYVQVGEDEVFELVQSYWSGAPYNPDKKMTSSTVKISIVELNGKKTSYEQIDTTPKSKSNKNEIDVLVNYLDEYVSKNNIDRAKKIWMQKLEPFIPLEEILAEKFDGTEWPVSNEQLSPVIGMIDDPANQNQYVLSLNFTEEGHTAIYGSPGSGKTTLLQTLVASLCMMYTPEFINIYIMDFGGWSMNIFRDFPHVGGIANDNEEEKIEKLARMILKELDIRKKKFAELGVGNINAYKQETGENIPYIMLILDNFAPVLNLYPDLEMFFINLTREGGNYGIYFVATCNTVMALGYKMGQNIKMSLALQMTEKADYSTIVGKTDGLEPEKNEGRGLVKGTPPLEFQTALPANSIKESERVKLIKHLAEEMSEKWNGKKAKPIPIMPEVIKFDSDISEDITIGLSTQDIEPMDISFKGTHYIIISGKPESGKTNAIKVIMKQFKEAQKVVFDLSCTAYESVKDDIDEYITEADKVDLYLEQLVPLLQERSEQYKSGQKKDFEPILIVIDNLKEIFDGISDKSANRLNAIVALGKGLNVNLLVAGNCDDIAKMYNQGEPFTVGMVKSQIGVLIGGCFRDHNVFKSNLHYSEVDTELNDYEAYLVIKEKATKIKVMFER